MKLPMNIEQDLALERNERVVPLEQLLDGALLCIEDMGHFWEPLILSWEGDFYDVAEYFSTFHHVKIGEAQ